MPRLDVWLVKEGHFSSRQIAQRAIKEGYVTVNGIVVKASKNVDGSECITISEKAINIPFGYRKLEKIDQLLGGVLVESGFKAVDIGTSAGGFLQYLIEKGVMVTGIEVSDEFIPHLSKILADSNNAVLVIADAFRIDPQMISERQGLDLLLIDVTTELEGTLNLIRRFTERLKERGTLICAFKTRLTDDIRGVIERTLEKSFDILHFVELEQFRKEFHLVAKRHILHLQIDS